MDYRDDNGYYYSDSNNNDFEGRRSRSGASHETSSKRQHTSAVAKRIKKKQQQKQRREAGKKVLTALLVCAVICIIVGSGVFVGMYTAVSTELEDMNINNLALNYPSYIYYEDSASNVNEYDTITSADNIIWVSSEEIGDNMKDAIVAIEDQRFYKHNGVDLKRTAGAFIKYALSKVGIGEASYGGSTITQQVIKNITQEKDQTPARKVKEIMRAISLEKNLDKDEILTIYLNIVYFANKCYGVESAANTYFNKSSAELSVPEAAMIAGITQTPAKFDPYAHPDNALKKRNTVLGKMKELGMISAEEYEEAVASDLNVTKNNSKGTKKINSYFVDQLINDIIADLKSQHGYSEDFAKQQLYNGGLKIYATIDPDVQESIDKVYEKTSNFPSKKIQSAITVIDPYTGQIKGMAGGIGKKTENRIWNRATQTKRQPGSAIKPLSAYAPALNEGKITSSDIFVDEKITIGHDDWTPSNSYSGFKGKMPLREAVGRSVNTIAVQVVDMIGLGTSYNYLQNKFHLNSVESKDKNYSSLSLGGLTKGASTTEMAAAYSTFVNEGKYIEPHTYTRVEDSNGKVLLENKESTAQAISAEAAYIISDLLLAPVNESYGTARSAKLPDMTTYGKTGTTNDNFDKWFIGYTPYYVAAVWCGYDSQQAISASSNPSVSVWKKVMLPIHEGLSDKSLKKPSGITEEEVCTVTGKLAKSSCPSETAYFKSGTQPVQFCNGHSSKSKSKSKTDSEDKKTEEPVKTTPRPTEKTPSIVNQYDEIPETYGTPSPDRDETPASEEVPQKSDVSSPVEDITPTVTDE